MIQRRILRYSEGFKLQIVQDLEEGRFGSVYEIQKHYGIRGAATVQRWLKKFGKHQYLGKVIRVEKPEERSEIEELRQRVRQLEKIVADQHICHEVDISYLEIACERAGIKDIERFKKKSLGIGATNGPAARRKARRQGAHRESLWLCRDEPSELLSAKEATRAKTHRRRSDYCLGETGAPNTAQTGSFEAAATYA